MNKLASYIITIDVPFASYSSTEKNKKAISGIKKWIKHSLENECSYIPLYVEKIGDSPKEDCSYKSSIKIEVMNPTGEGAVKTKNRKRR